MAEGEARVELDAAGIVEAVAHQQLLRVDAVVQVVGLQHTGKLVLLEVGLVLLVRQRDGQLGARVHLAEKHVGDGVAGLLARHEVGEHGGHLVEPGQKEGAGHAGHHDGPRVGTGHGSDHVVLHRVLARADDRVAEDALRVAGVVQREARAVPALAGAAAHEDDGHVGGRGQRGGGGDVQAVVEADLGALARRGGDALERRDVVGGAHLARAVAVGERAGIVRGEADKRQLLPLRQGQRGLLVLQQHRRLRAELPRQRVVLGARDVGEELGDVPGLHGHVHDAHGEHGVEDAADGLVELLPLRAGRQQGQGVRVLARGHLHVQALLQRGAVRGAPVRHDESREVQLVLQVPQRRRVLAAVGAVKPVVAAHDRAEAHLHGALEGRVVHLEERALVDVLAHVHAVRLLAVAHEVLAAGDDLLVLDAFHGGLRKHVAEVGILSCKIFEVATVLRHAGQVQARAELHVGALVAELAAHGGAPLVHRLRVPRGRDRHGAGPGGGGVVREGRVAEALRPIMLIQGRDAQALDGRDETHVRAGHAGAVQHVDLLDVRHAKEKLGSS
mmetsp:Transcript_38302/g.121722  ORF Transcript_38302/g.121722 Transcript_38302/m.121722 type:complete len:559 (-) Transcript_38302:24-1700(-)